MSKFRTTIVREVTYRELVEYLTDAEHEDEIDLDNSTFFLVKERSELNSLEVNRDVREVRNFPTVA